MATLVATPKDLLHIFTHAEGENWDAWIKRSQDKIAELEKASNALPEGEVKGALLSYSVADGHAYYLVTSAKPLKLAHLPFLDGYAVQAPLIRGLRTDDVLQKLEHARQMDALFRRHRSSTHPA